jgi:four helix bundle protein
MDDKRYDLEDRTHLFAKRVRAWVKRLPRLVWTIDDIRQVVRSSGSVAANYIEANESLGDKDFLLRIRIARKESKETRLWLNLIDKTEAPDLEAERADLIQEATELMNIFGAIIRKRS